MEVPQVSFPPLFFDTSSRISQVRGFRTADQQKLGQTGPAMMAEEDVLSRDISNNNFKLAEKRKKLCGTDNRAGMISGNDVSGRMF